MVVIERINDFELKVIRAYAGDIKNTVGYIEYYQEIGKGVRSWIKHIQIFSLIKNIDLPNPILVKEAITWFVDLFINDKADSVEYLVAKGSPAEYACRAFCYVMGGEKTEMKLFNTEDKRHEWEEFIILKNGFKNKKYKGSIDDIVKVIVHETNILKRQYK